VNVISTAEGDLIAGLRRGDAGAWSELCNRFGDPLYRYAFHLSGGEHSLAEDIRQESLLAAAEAIHTFRGDAPLFGWLCAIARRKAADEIRRRGRMAELPSEKVLSSDCWDRMDREELPEQLLERAEVRARIVRAMGNLPPEYGRMLIARYADGTGVGDLAQRLGRSYKATESLLSRARAALRDQLREVDYE